MQQKLLAIRLLGVSALIFYYDLNWNGVYGGEGMSNPINIYRKITDISRSGDGIKIQISTDSRIPPELNSTVPIERAVCIMMEVQPTIKDDFTVTNIRIHQATQPLQLPARRSDLTNEWSLIKTNFYICTSLQEAGCLFHRVELIYAGSKQRVSKAILYDKTRFEAEREEIDSGENKGKSTAAIKVVTYRNYNDWKTERKYSGAVKIITL